MTGVIMPRLARGWARIWEGCWLGGGGTADASQRRRYAGEEGRRLGPVLRGTLRRAGWSRHGVGGGAVIGGG